MRNLKGKLLTNIRNRTPNMLIIIEDIEVFLFSNGVTAYLSSMICIMNSSSSSSSFYYCYYYYFIYLFIYLYYHKFLRLKFYFLSPFFPVDPIHVLNPFTLILAVSFCIHEFRCPFLLLRPGGHHDRFL